MPGDALRAYHGRTKHSLASVRSDPHHLDWDNQPIPFKVYPDLEPIPLPTELPGTRRFALDAIAGEPADAPEPVVDLARLAHLLYFSAGVLRRRTYPGGEILYRAAACTGALYHIDLYVAAAELADLPAGLYHFGPHDFALRRLRSGDHRGVLVEAAAAPAIATAPVVLVATSTFWRNAWKYRSRTYRHAYWDAGTLGANLLAVAAAVSLPAHVILGFVDDRVNRLLDVDPSREAALALIALGTQAPAPPPAPPLEPLGFATLPLSAHEIDYPLVREAHAASSLPSADAVRAWRKAGAEPPAPSPSASPDAIPIEPLPASVVAEPVEAVVLRRGSTRRFPRAPIPLDRLATILHVATRPVSMDVTAPPDLYVIANAVDGLAAGTYAIDASGRALRRLRPGDFRRDAGVLDLGQELAADAAANLYWLVDLERVFARLGDRGYRAAALAAAIAGGRAYLAAYALGLGATGLTFFDDDVTAFFSPDAAGKSVLFLVAVGQRGTRRR